MNKLRGVKSRIVFIFVLFFCKMPYNEEVYTRVHRKIQIGTALATLTLFAVVMLFHPFLPHHHEHALFEASVFETIHTGVMPHSAVTVALPVYLFGMLPVLCSMMLLLRALRQRGVQHVDIPVLLSLPLLLRQGILNTKAY